MEMNEFTLREFIASLEKEVSPKDAEEALRGFCNDRNLAPYKRDVWNVGRIEELLRGCTTRDKVHDRLTWYFGTVSTKKVDAFIEATGRVLTDKFNACMWPALAAVDYNTVDVPELKKVMQEAALQAHRETKSQVINIGEIRPPRVPPKQTEPKHTLHTAALQDANTALNNALCEFEVGVREDHLYQPNTETLFKRTLHGPAFHALENAAKALSTCRQLEKKRKRDEEDPESSRAGRAGAFF